MGMVGELTPIDKFGVGAADLGIARALPSGRTALIFGDTFSGHRVGDGDWRSPVILYSSSGDPSGGLVVNGAVGGDYARQIFSYDHNNPEFTTILPTDAIVVGGRLYLHVIVTRGLGNELRTELHVSDDEGETWEGPLFRLPASDSNGQRVMWTMEYGDDGWVYAITTGGLRRERNAYLWRVPPDRIADPRNYEPWGWNGTQWTWGGHPSDILPLATECGEVNLRRVEGKWIFTYFDKHQYCITVKVFDNITDNLYEAPTFHPVLGRQVPQLYGGYVVPGSTLEHLHFLVSQWNTTAGWPYHVLQFETNVSGNAPSPPWSNALAKLKSGIDKLRGV